jgi:hypothetical protein
MKSRWRTPLAMLAAAALLVLGLDVATYAANGQSLLLGKLNTATKVTKIKRTTPGPVLQLKSKAGTPPLKVNSSAKVAKLNADSVDGLDAADLQTNVDTVSLTLAVDSGTTSWPITQPAGTYLVTWSASFEIVGSDAVVCGILSNGRYLAGNKNPVGADVTVDILSGSAVVTLSDTLDEAFFCNPSGGTIEAFNASEGITLAFQELARVSATTQVPARGTARRPGNR